MNYIDVRGILPDGFDLQAWLVDQKEFVDLVDHGVGVVDGVTVLAQPIAIRLAIDLFPNFALAATRMIDVGIMKEPHFVVGVLQSYVQLKPNTQFDKALIKILSYRRK